MKKWLLLTVAIIVLSCHQDSGKIEMVSAEQVYEAIYGNEKTQIIDVRSENEYKVSHLKNAQNICVSKNDFEEKASHLDKSKPVYVYCKGGMESAQAAQILKKMGFTKVYDLQGGIDGWQEEGLETLN